MNMVDSVQAVGMDCIVKISSWDRVKIHICSLLCGLWILLKRFLLRFWKPNAGGASEKRGSPPACLLETPMGTHSFVKLKGVKLHYVECGGGRDKPLVILLHGFPDCWIGWRQQVPILSCHFRVVALDLKGFGDSDKPLSARSYQISTVVTELRSLITSLGVRSCVIVGHDLGALLGWFLVHCYPDVVTKFVAISCPHPNVYWSCLPKASAFNSRWLHLSQLPSLAEMEALTNDLGIIDQCYQHLKNKKGQEAYLDAYKYTFSRSEDWTGPINYYRNLPFWRVSEGKGTVNVPTLLLTGNKDPWVNLESIVKSSDYVDKFLVKMVEGAGHFPHQECPEAVNKLLLSFLIEKPQVKSPQRESSLGLVNRMFSSTMLYGKGMLDVVQKTTSGVTTFPTRALALAQSGS